MSSPVFHRLLAAGVAVTLVEGAACLPPAEAGAEPKQPPLAAPTRCGAIANPAVGESSGIVPSRRCPGLFWTHNDSGNPPTLYAIDADGKSTGQCRLQGARNVDWEDIAMDEAGKLYVADVGNNTRSGRVLTIYAVPEPDPKKTGQATAEAAARFRYPSGHGPFDCEAMFVRKGWAYLITKEVAGARLYRVRLAGAPGGIARAEALGPLPGAAWITAADIAPDGRHIAALSYSAVYVYDLPAPLEELVEAGATGPSGSTRPAEAIRQSPRKRAVRLGQCEAICWIPGKDAADLLITNEQRDMYRLAAAVGAAASAPSR